MKRSNQARRDFLSKAGMIVGAALTSGKIGLMRELLPGVKNGIEFVTAEKSADYTLRIGAAAVEIGKKHLVSAVTYNGQFPGPLLRFKEGTR
jgi:FtsP/CotA-like multicopper oxidase with cupredoxin domain